MPTKNTLKLLILRIVNIDVISNLMFSLGKPIVAIICLLWLCQIILGNASNWEKTHLLDDHKAYRAAQFTFLSQKRNNIKNIEVLMKGNKNEKKKDLTKTNAKSSALHISIIQYKLYKYNLILWLCTTILKSKQLLWEKGNMKIFHDNILPCKTDIPIVCVIVIYIRSE